MADGPDGRAALRQEGQEPIGGLGLKLEVKRSHAHL